MVRFYFNIFSSLLMKFFGSVPHVQFIELFSSGLVRFRFCWTEFCLIVVLLEGDLFGRCVVGRRPVWSMCCWRRLFLLLCSWKDLFGSCAVRWILFWLLCSWKDLFRCCAIEKDLFVVVLLDGDLFGCCAVKQRTEFNFVHV